MKIKKNESKLSSIIAIFLLTTAAAFGANQSEGSALIVAAADDAGVCPVQHRPVGSSEMAVFIAGMTEAR
ncbi:MAG TPA: hypothetical protein VF604_02290 [Pyrinomonadaceae bacterium]|jgi:hypothetical protein